MKSGVSRAEANRAIRQEELRAKLACGGHLQHAVDNINKIQDLAVVLESADINRLKIATEFQFKLINKYLPDVKQVEVETNMNLKGDVSITLVRAEIVNGSATT